MKQFYLLIISCNIFFAFTQDLKTYSGSFQETIWGEGKATYTYYEKDDQEVRHGKFNYEWTDNDTKKVQNKNYSYKMSKKITGSYKNGRKDGVWTFKITFKDYPLHVQTSYESGSITKTASYIEGKPHGKWRYRQSYKSRKMNRISSYSWNWSNYSKLKNVSVDAEFKNGKIVGSLKYEDPVLNNEFGYFKFDNEGYLTGEQKVKSLGNEYTIVIKDRVLIKEKTRMSDGSVKIPTDLSDEDLTSDKYGQVNLQFDYVESKILKWFKQFKYFNQECCIARTNKKPLIYGCDLYEYGLEGAKYIELVEAVPLSEKVVKKRLTYVKTEAGKPLFINQDFIDYSTKKLKLTLFSEEEMITKGLGAHIHNYDIKAINLTNKQKNNNKKEFTLQEIWNDVYRLKLKVNGSTKGDSPILSSDLEVFNDNVDEILSKIEIAQEKRKVWVSETYEKHKTKADELFESENLIEAIEEYKLASKVKPGEKYPKEQIGKLTNTIYEKHINQGDQYFDKENYTNAIKKYKLAKKVKPNENYPNEQIEKGWDAFFSDENYEKYLLLNDTYLDLIFSRLDKSNKIEKYKSIWLMMPSKGEKHDYFNWIDNIDDIGEKVEVLNDLQHYQSYANYIQIQKTPLNERNAKFNDIEVYWKRYNDGERKRVSITEKFRTNITQHDNYGDLDTAFESHKEHSKRFLENALVGDLNYLRPFAKAYMEVNNLDYFCLNLSPDDVSFKIDSIRNQLSIDLEKEKEKSLKMNYEHLMVLFKNIMSSEDKSETEELIGSIGIEEKWVKLYNVLEDYGKFHFLSDFKADDSNAIKKVNKKIITLLKLVNSPSDKIKDVAKKLKRDIRKENYDAVWEGLEELL